MTNAEYMNPAVTLIEDLPLATTNANNEPPRTDESNSTVTEVVLVEEESETTFLIICIVSIVLVFALSTLIWFRKRKDTPAAKKKAHQLKLKRQRALEEKRIGAVSLDSIPCSQFLDVYKRRLKDDILSVEFKALSRLDEDYPQLIANLPCNYYKNSSRNVLPYDHCRVCLETPPNMVDADYINASIIFRMNANKKVKAYIASQGPLSSTVTDFWRMIWQEGINTIVMLNNVFSYSKQECEKYWHNIYSMYGDIHVRQDLCSSTCHYTIRRFTISKVGYQVERVIQHFQFHTWIEQEMPDIPSVLEFQRRIKHWHLSSGAKGPVLVHCSNGAGRTGAFIALDIVLDNMRNKGTVDILPTITSIRKFRPSMVNNLTQLKFLYDAVAILLTCGVTVVQVGELDSLVQEMGKRDSNTKLSGFEREYKILREITPRLTIGDCAGGHRVENRRKSRDIMIQPPERARPYLMTFDSTDSSDFINAVYCNGYNTSNEFIISQWPMKNTCNDLWRLIFDAHVTSVVVLHDCTSSRNFPEFWPKKEGVKERYGPVCSTLQQIEHTQSLVIKTFHVKKVYYIDLIQFDNASQCSTQQKKVLYKNISHHICEMGEALINPADIASFGAESRPVQIFFLKNWHDSHKVPSQNYSLLELIDTSAKWKKSLNAAKTPTLVISKNGVSRAGVFCALSISVDKLRNEGEVDVFNATKTIMYNRPQLIENLTEYTYLYTFLASLSDRAGLSMDRSPSVYTPLEVDTTPAGEDNRPATTRPILNSSNSSNHLLMTKPVGNHVSPAQSDNILMQTLSRTSQSPTSGSQQQQSPTDSNKPMGSKKVTLANLSTTPKPKYTDGKSFLHYAVPAQADGIEEESAVDFDDTASCASSFKMDSDILSLENAEFAAESYNNNYLEQFTGNRNA